MPKLNDLGLTNEAVGPDQNYADVPDQMGGAYPDPPQPGAYRFRFPVKLDEIWDTFDHTTGNPPGTRIRASFDEAHPLLIIQSPKQKYDGDPFQTRISNAERKRGRADDQTAPYVSDMDYIFRDVFGLPGKPKDARGVISNAAYGQQFMKLASGQEMSADIEWNWSCNKNKPVRVADGNGGYMTLDDRLGCNQKYYQKDVEKVHANPDDPNSELEFPVRITCACGAVLRAFPNLTRFRK